MSFADTLKGLLRRWYITVPGLLLAVAVALGVYAKVPPEYERTATQVLLPGEGSVPEGATNPYLYIGGLTQAADIIVRVLASEEIAGAVAKDHPGTKVVVERDPTAAGPLIQIRVTSDDDAVAGAALTQLTDETARVLAQLQKEQHVSRKDTMTSSTLTFDEVGQPQQKMRLALTAGAGLLLAALALVAASLVDGLLRDTARQERNARCHGERRAKKDAKERADARPDAADETVSADAELEADAEVTGEAAQGAGTPEGNAPEEPVTAPGGDAEGPVAPAAAARPEVPGEATEPTTVEPVSWRRGESTRGRRSRRLGRAGSPVAAPADDERDREADTLDAARAS